MSWPLWLASCTPPTVVGGSIPDRSSGMDSADTASTCAAGGHVAATMDAEGIEEADAHDSHSMAPNWERAQT